MPGLKNANERMIRMSEDEIGYGVHSGLTRAEMSAYLVALESAILEVVDYISFNGQQVKYRSLDDMLRVRRILRGWLGLDAGNRSLYRGPRRAVIRMGNLRAG